METLLVSAKIDVVGRKLGFDGCFVVLDLVECSGGLAMLCKFEINFKVHNDSLRHISGWVTNEGQNVS